MISITLDDQTARQGLARLLEQAGNTREVLGTVAASIHEDVLDGFSSGKDPYGKPWAKPRLRNGQPLRDTGRLMNSFSWRADGHSAHVGTNIFYAFVHQYGATITAKNAPFLRFGARGGPLFRKKSVTIPERLMLPDRHLPSSWGTNALEALSDYLTQGLAR